MSLLLSNRLMKTNSLKKLKHGYLIDTSSDKDFKGLVENQALPCLHGDNLK